jgi:hypothetical protein
MNRVKILLLGGCLVAAIVPQTSSAAAAIFLTKDGLSDGSYCHMKFPAIVEATLSTAQPVLKDVSEGDIIDFYGSCTHDPLGAEPGMTNGFKRHLDAPGNPRVGLIM